MSPLSTDCLSIFLSPLELVTVLWRGLPQRIVAKRIDPIAPRGAAANADATAATSAALLGILREFASPRTRLTLSSHYTRYLLLPWRADLNDSDEEHAAARLAFVETFGAAAAGWRIRLGDETPGHTHLAAAVDDQLITAIEQAAQTANTRLLSVQPYLVSAANRWRHRIAGHAATWLVLHEEQRACLALIEAGEWRWVRSMRLPAGWIASLPELIEHEDLLAGRETAAAEVLLFAPGEAELAANGGGGQSFRRLQLEPRSGFSPLTDAHFGCALVA